MPNAIKYNVSAETLALKKGNFYIGTGDVGKGPTSSTGYYNGITPPSGGYTIYLNKETGGPSIYTVTTEAQMVSLTNTIGAQSFTTSGQCLNWFATQTDKMIFNRDYPAIVTDGLVLNVDAGFTPSYPTTATTWYDVSSGGNNGTLVNGPTFSSSNGGVISFDGTNDSGQWASGGAITANLNTWYNDPTRTLQMWINFSNLNSGQLQSITSLGDDEVQYGFAIFNSRWAMFSNSLYATVGNALSTNTWYFVTLLRTGETSWTIYQGTTNIGNVTQNAGISSFGGDYQFQLMCNGYGNHKQGTVGQVLFYNKVLSASEIANNYEATKSRFGL